MTFFAIKDTSLEIAKGNITGHSAVHKFGENPDVGGTSTEDVTFSGTINFLTAATTVRIKAGGNAADDSAGLGAQDIIVEGLDGSWNEVSESIQTNGATESSNTTASFIRVYRAYVTDVGTYGAANTGDIVVENSAGGTDLITIPATKGQSETSEFTIPAGKTGYLTRLACDVDSQRNMDLSFFQRQNADDATTPFTGKRLIAEFPALSNNIREQFNSYIVFPEKTDLWWTVTNNSGSSGGVEVDYDLFLVDN